MKIRDILTRIDERQLFVPAFQREYVWKREDAKELIDSLLKDYPTGTMLTWDTNRPPELKGDHKYNPMQGSVKILLDGQQRITTLYMLVRGELPPYYTQAEIMVDTRGLYVQLETLQLEYYAAKKMDADPRWRSITDVFQNKVKARHIRDALKAERGESLSQEMEDQINDNINKIALILDREFEEQRVPASASIRNAIDIFYKVNASGVTLTDAELALAQISGYWPQARDTFKNKLAQLAEHGFVFKLDFVVYALLGCVHHAGADLRKLHGDENDAALREAWARLDGSVLDYVANLLRSYAFVDHSDEINSVYALIPMIVYVFDKKNAPLSDVDIRKMVKWFYYSQIRGRYVNQLQQKLDYDLRILAASENPFDDLLRVIEEERPLEITPSEFAGSTVLHPLFGLMRWYFKSKQAICFTTGVQIRKPMGKKYQLENDHIFAFAKLKQIGYGKNNRVKYSLAQELTNRAILTQTANRSKSDALAADYLDGVKERFPSALKLQCVPDDRDLWKLENYERFLDARRALLARELNQFLANLANTQASELAVSLDDLIREGETSELEFKSSMRWDYKQQIPNKKLEDVILKTIAALSNAQGGDLLIGVSDEGEILGLERDYACLGNVDRDKYELHLRNLINNSFGQAFAASRVRVSFPVLRDTEICQITVAPGLSPLFLNVADKNGQMAEKYYVRSGNSSQEMSQQEAYTYNLERFPASGGA